MYTHVKSMSLQTLQRGLAPSHLDFRERQESQARAVLCLLGFGSSSPSAGRSCETGILGALCKSTALVKTNGLRSHRASTQSSTASVACHVQWHSIDLRWQPREILRNLGMGSCFNTRTSWVQARPRARWEDIRPRFQWAFASLYLGCMSARGRCQLG